MNRGATASARAQWAAAANAPIKLIELCFDTADGGTVYLTDSYRTIVWGGNTYTALGHLLDFNGLSESMELRIADAQFELSGVDQILIAAFLQREYVDRQLIARQAFLDSTGAVVDAPVIVHDGRMDDPRIVEDPDEGKCIVQVASRDQFADFERLCGRHTNTTEQQRFFPADQGFKNLAQTMTRPLVWGHLKDPVATGLGAALSRGAQSIGKLLGADV